MPEPVKDLRGRQLLSAAVRPSCLLLQFRDRCAHVLLLLQGRLGKPKPAVVPSFHFFVPFGACGVQLRRQVFVEDGHEHLTEIAAPGHPLEVVAAIVVIRPIELAAREGLVYPVEKGLVTDVHPQRDLGLTSISPKVPFTDQQTDHVPFVEVSRQKSPPFS